MWLAMIQFAGLPPSRNRDAGRSPMSRPHKFATWFPGRRFRHMTLPSPTSRACPHRRIVGSVTIMVPDPFHRDPEIVLVTTLGRLVENHIRCR